ncbi:hypothetical protein A1F97_07006 [Pyrenophora tritici-repentis]|nr:hypothetical protein A1F97_07006 [Pyrenophora tritici-repentis]
MSNCSLVAPGLPSLVGGAIPTFAYDHAEHGFLSGDDFGIEMAYMSGTSTCFHSEMATLTPILSNPRLYYTRTCQYVTIGTTYTALECPKGRLWDWVNRGEYIIDNKLASPYSGQTPRPFTATFGNSAAPPVSITTSLTLTRPFTTTKSGNYYPFSPVTITRTTATSTSTSLSTVTVPVTVPVLSRDHASDPIIELILDPGIVELKLKLCYVYLGSAIIKLIIGLIKHIIELNIKLILKLILKLCYVYLSSAIIELILDPDILKLKPCCVYLGSAIVFSILDHVSCRQRN